MRRLAGIAAFTALVSCATSSPPTPASTPVDTTALLPPAVDLSGTWATGSASEPPPGAVVLHPSCTHNPPVWLIEQNGNALKTWEFPESYNQGIVRDGPGVARITAVPGTISGNQVSIGDADIRLVLGYDAGSGHLRGTRNGAPFWAARQTIVRTEACPGVP